MPGQVLKTVCPLDCPDTCAARRGIVSRDPIRMWNDRGACEYFAEVTEDTREGVVVAEGLWWAKHTPRGRSANTLVSTRLTDLGEGSTFQCNLVEIAKARLGTTA